MFPIERINSILDINGLSVVVDLWVRQDGWQFCSGLPVACSSRNAFCQFSSSETRNEHWNYTIEGFGQMFLILILKMDIVQLHLIDRCFISIQNNLNGLKS